MIKKSLFLTLFFIGLIFGTAKGASVDSVYTLQKCINLALENNKKGLIARTNEEIASEISKEAFTKYFPEVSAMGMWFQANHDIIQYNILDIIELGIIKKGKLAGVQALQPIFMGGMIVNGNKLAHLGEEVAKLRTEQSDNDIRLNTEKLYWKLVTLQATRETLDKGIAFLDSLTHKVSVAVDAGLVTRNDLLKVQLKRNSFLVDREDLDSGIKMVKMLLGQYMGLGIDSGFGIISEIPADVPLMPMNLYQTPKDGILQNSDYKLLTKNIEAKELEKRMELGNYLPKVALGLGWYYHDLFEQNHNFGAIQLAVDVPLSGWWGGSHNLKRKELELKNARNEFEDLSEQLMIEITDKWNNVTAAHRKMEIEKEGIEQSEENLNLNKAYYNAGMVTVSDLLEAETSYRESVDRYIASYAAFCNAQAEYMVTIGKID